MAWTTVVANPNFLGYQNRRRQNRLSLADLTGASSWGGSVDNRNFMMQVYRGRIDRYDRYRTYDAMDEDSDIKRALDIIAEHCVDIDRDGHLFRFEWSQDETTEEESQLVYDNLEAWGRLNKWKSRLFRVVRSALKYGDWFLFRDPNTFELYNLHPKYVLGGLVDRETNEIVGWLVRNFKFNVEQLELVVNDKSIQDTIRTMGTPNGGYRNTRVIPALHIVHLGLSEGRMSGSAADDDPHDRYQQKWPFGESVLEPAYTTFRQRQLLEQAVVIHRIQRAPSRTVWYIDTGKLRGDRASWAVQNFKNELNQSRIPQMISGMSGDRTVDSIYNPISQLEDIYIPVSFDARSSKVENLEGQSWDNLPELEYFNEKTFRAMRVPYAWMLGPTKGGAIFNDGRVGTAYQEEIEFSKMCSRLQNLLIEAFDQEFKLYCNWRDVNINFADFELTFNPPDNFEDSKQLARDTEAIGVWSSIKDDPTVSKRFSKKKYLKWTDDDLLENERMLMEERKFGGANPDDLSLGGGGPGMGALPPGPMMGPTGMNPMGQDQMGMGMTGDAGLGTPGTDMGAGAGGLDAGGTTMSGLGAGAGGMGESRIMRKPVLIEEKPIGYDDIKPAPLSKNQSRAEPARTPDDRSFMTPDLLHNRMPITLKLLRKIRVAQMTRRVQNQKRIKMVRKIYDTPPNPEGGGLGGAL